MVQLDLLDFHATAVRPPESSSSSAMQSPSLDHNSTQPHLLKHNSCASRGNLPALQRQRPRLSQQAIAKCNLDGPCPHVPRSCIPIKTRERWQHRSARRNPCAAPSCNLFGNAAMLIGAAAVLVHRQQRNKTHLHSPQVVCPNRDEGALAAQIGVQLVLEVDEAVVACSIKLDSPQDSAHEKGAHQRCLGAHHHALHLAACNQAGCRSGNAGA